jgi:hypothetical protein
LISCPLILELVCVALISLRKLQWHGIGFEIISRKGPVPSPIETYPLVQAATFVTIHIHPVLISIKTMAPTLDVVLETVVLATIVSSPIIVALTFASVCLVKVGSGTVSTTIDFFDTWWWHLAMFSCEVTSAAANTAISFVQVSGGAVPTAIFEWHTWWRNGTGLASVAASALALALIFVSSCRRPGCVPVSIAIPEGIAGHWWNGTVHTGVHAGTQAVASVSLVQIGGASVVAAVHNSITWWRH